MTNLMNYVQRIYDGVTVEAYGSKEELSEVKDAVELRRLIEEDRNFKCALA